MVKMSFYFPLKKMTDDLVKRGIVQILDSSMHPGYPSSPNPRGSGAFTFAPPAAAPAPAPAPAPDVEMAA
jgi:hypothetical protein